MNSELPTVLYHASENRELTILEPRAESTRNPNEGPVVFATASIQYASCFLVKTDDSWVSISSWGENNPWVFICSDRERFTKSDHGGAIYSLPIDSFEFDTDLAKLQWEAVTKIAVKPTRSDIYESGLDAMLQHGVQVFFLNQEEFYAVINSDDHGLSLLLEWQDTDKLENKKRGMRLVPII